MGIEKPQELRKIAEGREAEMFAWEDGNILRLMRDPEAQRLNELQAAAIEAARASGVRVPAVYGTTTVDGRPGLIMERIDGPDLLTLIGRHPWKVFWVGRVTGEIHARLHAGSASGGIPPLREALRQRLGTPSRLPRHLAEFALDVLDGLPDGDALCHGDFHPANVMMSGDTPVVIDWTNVRRGDPTADVARTLLMLRLGEPPPFVPIVLRLAALVARRLLWSGYLRSYRRLRPLDMELLRRWEVVRAAERLAAEWIEGEEPALVRLLEERHAAARAAYG